MRKLSSGMRTVLVILVVIVLLAGAGWLAWDAGDNKYEPESQNGASVSFTAVPTSESAEQETPGYKINGNQITLFLGQRNSGGYGYEVTEITKNGDTLDIYTAESTPGKGCIVTMVLTSPQVTVDLERPITETIRIHKTVQEDPAC